MPPGDIWGEKRQMENGPIAGWAIDPFLCAGRPPGSCAGRPGILPALFAIKRRVEGVEILRVELIGGQAKSFAEALVVHDLTLAQEADLLLSFRASSGRQSE